MFSGLKDEKKSAVGGGPEDRGRRTAEIFNRELSSIFNRTERRRLAPLPPMVSDFDQRIKKLREKGHKRGRRYSVIGISASILIALTAAGFSYIIIRELSGINDRIDERGRMFEGVVKERTVDCSNDCCQDSLYIINQNHFQQANYKGRCPDGYNARSLSCAGSLVWCVPVASSR